MRNLDTYVEAYKAHGYEAVQAAFRRRTVLAFLNKAKARRILEVGCGLHPLFLDYSGFERFTVLEPALGFYEEARQVAHGLAGVCLLQATLEDAVDDLKGEEFDAVVLSSLLHEVPRPEALVQTARALMGPATRIHVNTPNARSFHRLLALEMGLIQSLTELSATQIRLQQHGVFTKESLRALLEAEGLVVEEEGTLFLKPFTHGQMAALMEQGLMTQAMLEGLNRMVQHAPDLGSELFANARKRT